MTSARDFQYDLLIRGGTIVQPGQGAFAADVATRGEIIAAILEPGRQVLAATEIDARGLHVLPGAIDTHTHWGYRGSFRDQCRADSRAAAVGGVSTALLYHRFAPSEFETLIAQGEQEAVVDFGLSPTVFDSTTADALGHMVTKWGCPSIKFYLAYRDIPNAPPGDDWNHLTDGLLVKCLEKLSGQNGTMACFHAENAEIIAHAMGLEALGDDLAAWEIANPEVAEAEAIVRGGFLAEWFNVPAYFVHLSGRKALASLARVRASHKRVFGETCPHYLLHNIGTSSTRPKFSPPVRRREDSDALWRALAAGELQCVGSDNSPTLEAEKIGTVWDIARGGPGAGIVLPVVLSHGVNAGRLTLEQAVRITAENPARIFGLYPQKGALRIGSDADIILVDLKRQQRASCLPTYSDYSLYDDFLFKGWPIMTLVRGHVVADDGEVRSSGRWGKFLKRAHAGGLGNHDVGR